MDFSNSSLVVDRIGISILVSKYGISKLAKVKISFFVPSENILALRKSKLNPCRFLPSLIIPGTGYDCLNKYAIKNDKTATAIKTNSGKSTGPNTYLSFPLYMH